ncbi:hypothetical protein [Brevibacillus marinus]|uniref:hypothetical protein n=1 Tax=Brevibacillus marinus TaxID=2496837 RepID=UPI000F849002|nr:hypothetical protein [Brevibacillus marinus]
MRTIFTALHLFCGIVVGGALGFQNAREEWRGVIGRIETLVGIDLGERNRAKIAEGGVGDQISKEEMIRYEIPYHTKILREEEEFLQHARDQLKQHYRELNISSRKKAENARESIEYLEKFSLIFVLRQ